MDNRQITLRHIEVLRQVRLNERHVFKQTPPQGGRFYRLEFDGLDAKGIRRIEYQRIACSSVREARLIASELRVAAQRNWLDINEDITLAAWLNDWLYSHCDDVTARTRQGYEQIARCHLIPALGRLRLSDITPVVINRFYAEQRRSGLSSQTVLHHHRCLCRALRQAVSVGHLARTPMTDAVRKPKVARKERVFLQHSEVARLLQVVQGRAIQLPAMFAVLCGMRAGEICALRWSDIDLTRQVVCVQRAVEECTTGIRLKQPKSAKGIRSIPMPSELQSALVDHKSSCAAQSLDLARPDAFLFGENPLTPLRTSTLSNRWRVFAKRHGFAGVRFHDLRHTYASMVLHEGAGIFIASRLLGHATAQLTTDLYGHLLSDHAELAVQISRSIQKASA